jgi:hypothetical protein
MSDGRQALTIAPEKRGAPYRDAIAAFALTLFICSSAAAQLGPVEARGYVEYRYIYQAANDRDGAGTQGAALRMDLSTFVWRPWILNARGSLLVQEFGADSAGVATSSSALQGGLWLDFLARSKFPLTVYYENFVADFDSEPFRRTTKTRGHGFRQQLSSKRLGIYSLAYRRNMTDSLYADGVTLPTINDSERWDFNGNKTIGRNRFALISRSLEIDAKEPDVSTDSLRHTVRHNFRPSSRFHLQNTFFVTNEKFASEYLQSDRKYQQLYSLATWRPGAANRWLITGRGLFQENESASPAGGGAGLSSASMTGTVSYRVTDRTSLTGALGIARMENGMGSESTMGYQQLGANHNSAGYPLWGAVYQYSGRASIGNRSESGSIESEDLRETRFEVGHGLSRAFETAGGKRINLRAVQRVTTTNNSSGAELNILRSSFFVTSGVNEQQWSRYLRLGITDQRTLGDAERKDQLVDVQYNLQGNLTRDRSWSLSASGQYGLREQTKPPDFVNESRSLSYSITAAYRHANLFDVSFLNYSSELRFQSQDFQSGDPFDADFDFERQRANSLWRNRLDYRVGLLHLWADLVMHEADGTWFSSFRFTARRYFGMR